MGKRSNFPRMKRDYYRTWDRRAVRPLLPHLKAGQRFVEPCAGAGDLVGQLVDAGLEMVDAYDVEPKHPAIRCGDAFAEDAAPIGSHYITNPPWSREILHPLIVHLSDRAPTWLLFDAPWIFTGQAAPFMDRCRRIVAVGRVQWFEDTDNDAQDDVCWYLFDRPQPGRNPEFFAKGVPCA
jgi:hypothetical protein